MTEHKALVPSSPPKTKSLELTKDKKKQNWKIRFTVFGHRWRDQRGRWRHDRGSLRFSGNRWRLSEAAHRASDHWRWRSSSSPPLPRRRCHCTRRSASNPINHWCRRVRLFWNLDEWSTYRHRKIRISRVKFRSFPNGEEKSELKSTVAWKKLQPSFLFRQ